MTATNKPDRKMIELMRTIGALVADPKKPCRAPALHELPAAVRDVEAIARTVFHGFAEIGRHVRRLKPEDEPDDWHAYDYDKEFIAEGILPRLVYDGGRKADPVRICLTDEGRHAVAEADLNRPAPPIVYAEECQKILRALLALNAHGEKSTEEFNGVPRPDVCREAFRDPDPKPHSHRFRDLKKLRLIDCPPGGQHATVWLTNDGKTFVESGRKLSGPQGHLTMGA